MECTFKIYNFGCKVNQEEGGALAALFVASGWHEAKEGTEATLMIINTCTVTQVADKKVRNLIRRLHREHPQSILAVCGCYAQRAADEIRELDAAHLIVGVEERAHLPQLVEEYLAARSECLIAVGEIKLAHEFQRISVTNTQHRARAYLKIEDGCDQFCHYCIIPHVRGPVRSLPLDQVVEQAEQLLADGHAEIVLSGIHIGAYGKDFGKPDALVGLIERLVRLKGLLRLRLGSIEPQQFSDSLIEMIGREPKLCRHLHIPLQSGCDRTLAEMGRHYDTHFYAELLARLRMVGGDIAFTSDVMVGFPGESDADFCLSRDFCRDCGFADLHIFPYSRRQGTKAAEFPDQVRQSVKASRAAELAAVAAESSRCYAEQYIGRKMTFLVEDSVELDGIYYLRGHSDNYLSLLLPDDGQDRVYRYVQGYKWQDGYIFCVETK